jgi:hypothetical protein
LSTTGRMLISWSGQSSGLSRRLSIYAGPFALPGRVKSRRFSPARNANFVSLLDRVQQSRPEAFALDRIVEKRAIR